jgi:hypothetical protein
MKSTRAGCHFRSKNTSGNMSLNTSFEQKNILQLIYVFTVYLMLLNAHTHASQHICLISIWIHKWKNFGFLVVAVG